MVETGKYKKNIERGFLAKLRFFFSSLMENANSRNFLFALFFSTLIYYYLDGLVTESREKIVSFQVSVEDPRVQVSLKKYPIHILLRGPKEAFTRLELQPIFQKIEYEDLEGKRYHHKKIAVSNVLNVPREFQILEIEPEFVTLELTKIETHMSKVFVVYDDSQLRPNYKVSEISCNPPFLKLTGPSLELEKYKTVNTEKIILDQNTHLGQQSIIVQPEVSKEIQYNTVEVKIQIVEEITLNFPDVKIALLVRSPGLKRQIKKIAPIEVKLKGPDFLLRMVQSEGLKAYIDFTDIDEEYEERILAAGSPIKRKVRFMDLPEGVTKPELEINVEFIK